MHPMATKCCYTSIIMWQLLLRRKPEWAEKCSHVGMSWHENTFSITCLMYGECAGHRWSPSERVEYKVGTLNYFPFDFYQVISLLLLWYITTAKGRVLEYITLWCCQRRLIARLMGPIMAPWTLLSGSCGWLCILTQNKYCSGCSNGIDFTDTVYTRLRKWIITSWSFLLRVSLIHGITLTTVHQMMAWACN